MSGKDQVKPLAQSAISEEDEALTVEMKRHHNRRCLVWCGCISAVILILAVTILALAFTVFHVKDPVVKINSVTIQGLDLGVNSNLILSTNLTVVAHVAVKNPNVASFRFNNVTMTLYYDGTVIAEAKTPPGLAKARRTLFMDVTMVVLVDRVSAVPRLTNDLSARELPVRAYAEIRGKVKILIKKHVVVKMNCTMTVDLNSGSLKDQNCKKRISV